MCAAFEHEYALLRAAPKRQRRVLYCIWKDPWMAVSKQTYIAAMLAEIERERQQEAQRAEAAERARDIAVKAASSAAEAAVSPVDEVPAIMREVAPLQPASVP